MQPLVLAGLGLDPQLARILSKPIAWIVIGAVGLFLLRSSLVPTPVKLAVTVVAFMAAIGWADRAGLIQFLAGRNFDDADKLLVAIVGTFVLWLAFLRDERPQRSPTHEEAAPIRMLAGRRR